MEMSMTSAPLWYRVRALLQLLRPFNVALFMIGVAVGGLLVSGTEAFQGSNLLRLALAALSTALVCGGGNVINDIFDLQIDRVNRPERPLPSGRVAPQEAKWLWGATSVLGITLGLVLSPIHGILAGGAVLLLYIYSARLKRTMLLGNVSVALATALALVYGGLAVGPAGPALMIGAAFAFLTTLAREITKDIEDVRGDATGKAQTLPLTYGINAAVFVTAIVLVVDVLITPLPFLFLNFGWLFLILVLCTDALLLRALWLLWDSPAGSRAGQASRVLKKSKVIGLLALACAGILG